MGDRKGRGMGDRKGRPYAGLVAGLFAIVEPDQGRNAKTLQRILQRGLNRGSL